MPQLLMTQRDIDARPGEWKAIRRRGITASEIASVLDLAPDSYEDASPFALFTAKVTGSDFIVDKDELERGIALEPYVARRYNQEHPELTLREGGLYASAERPWQMATFDRLAASKDALRSWTFPVQLKTAVSRFNNRGEVIWGDDGSDLIPYHYRAQCLWELDVWDADRVVIPCRFMNNWEQRTYVIERDDEAQADIEYMREAGEEFLARIERDDPPPIDWKPATTKALKTLHAGEPRGTKRITIDLAERYKAARKAHDKTAKRLAQVQNEILAQAGDAREIVIVRNGEEVKVATRSQYPRTTTDTKTLRKKYPAIAKMVERTAQVTTLHPSSWSAPTRERNIRG